MSSGLEVAVGIAVLKSEGLWTGNDIPNSGKGAGVSTGGNWRGLGSMTQEALQGSTRSDEQEFVRGGINEQNAQEAEHSVDAGAPEARSTGHERALLTLRRAARPRWHDYTAFILTGGGARGALQVGALRSLLEHGIRPNVVIGTSIGSWNGAWMAAMPTLAGVDRLEEMWRHVHSTRILLGDERRLNSPLALSGMLLCSAAQRILCGGSSVYDDSGLRRLLSRCFGESTFDDLSIPLGVVAMDLTHGRRMVFRSGEVVPALLASSAIPGIFPPVRVGDTYYCDSAETDDVSFEAAVALGARRIYVLALDHGVDGDDHWGCVPKEPSRCVAQEGRSSSQRTTHRLRAHPLAGVLTRSSQVSSHYQLERALERLPIGIERHVIDLRTGNGAGILDFSSIETWLDDGYAQTNAYLRRGEQLLEIDEREDGECQDGECEDGEATEIAQAWGAA